MDWWLEFTLVFVAMMAGIAGVAAPIIYIGNRLERPLLTWSVVDPPAHRAHKRRS